jgi:CheY-like chemotaxis protein
MEEKPRVLVVDDEEVVLLSVRKALRKDGYQIETANAATEALTLLESNKYDVMITDLMMPGMDGMQLLDHAKSHYSDMRVVMITGFATMNTAMKAIRQGAFDFIAKPFTRSELGSAVSRAVRHGPMEQKPDKAVSAPEGLITPGNIFTLRDITWARIEADGKVTIGVEKKFIQSIGELLTVEIPEQGDSISQGNACSRITAGDARVHSVWSPLSGRIIQVNEELAIHPQLATEDPRGKGWLIRIDPTGIEHEVENLSQDI